MTEMVQRKIYFSPLIQLDFSPLEEPRFKLFGLLLGLIIIIMWIIIVRTPLRRLQHVRSLFIYTTESLITRIACSSESRLSAPSQTNSYIGFSLGFCQMKDVTFVGCSLFTSDCVSHFIYLVIAD
jgi:hypothetical protein